MVIDLFGRHTGDVILAMPALQTIINSGKPITVKISRQYWGLLKAFNINLTDDVNLPYDYSSKSPLTEHSTSYWLNLLSVEPTKSDIECIETPIFENYIILSPDSRDYNRRMDVSFWERAVMTAKKYEKSVIVIGPPDALDYNNKLCKELQITYNLTGTDTLPSLISLIKHADCVVTTDTAIAHFSDAIGTKTITGYNRSNPNVFHTFWNPMICRTENELAHFLNKILGS